MIEQDKLLRFLRVSATAACLLAIAACILYIFLHRDFTITEIKLPGLDDPHFVQATISDDGLHVDVQCNENPSSGTGRGWVIIDGRPGKKYDHLGPAFVRKNDWGMPGVAIFTPNHRAAYVARRRSKMFVVLDDQEGPEYDCPRNKNGELSVVDDAGQPILGVLLSPNERYAEYVSQQGGQWFLRRGNGAIPLGDTRLCGWPVLSDSGLIYVTFKDGKYRLIRNDREREVFDDVRRLEGATSGEHYALVARREDRWLLLHDDKQYESPVLGAAGLVIRLSPDGNRCACCSFQSGSLLLEGKTLAYAGELWWLCFSPNGMSVAFCISEQTRTERNYRRDGQRTISSCHVIWDGKPCPLFETPTWRGNGSGQHWFRWPHGLIFSPDSQRLAHQAEHNGNAYTVVDNSLHGPYLDVGKPVFSPDSRHLAWQARIGPDQLIVLDDVKGPKFEVVGEPCFSPDSKHMVYVAQGTDEHKPGAPSQGFLVVDGVLRPLPFDTADAYTRFSFEGPRTFRLILPDPGDGKPRVFLVKITGW